MNEANYTTVMSSVSDEDVEVQQMDLSNLKNEINLFLFKWLPDKSTIKDLERIACTMHRMIETEHN